MPNTVRYTAAEVDSESIEALTRLLTTVATLVPEAQRPGADEQLWTLALTAHLVAREASDDAYWPTIVQYTRQCRAALASLGAND